MRVEITHTGQVLVVESESPLTVSEILSSLDIPPSTVLAVFEDTIVPHTSLINDDIRLDLIVVSSGG
jgi:sulfur carrier protein ThiS